MVDANILIDICSSLSRAAPYVESSHGLDVKADGCTLSWFVPDIPEAILCVDITSGTWLFEDLDEPVENLLH